MPMARRRCSRRFDSRTTRFHSAHEMCAGGLAMHFLNGISCKALVLERLKPLFPNLSPSQRDEAVRLIDSLEAEAEDARVVQRRTRQWQKATFGRRICFDGWIETSKEMMQSRSFEPIRSSRRFLLSRQDLYLKEYIQPLRQKLEPGRE
jgi:hypothetical protein